MSSTLLVSIAGEGCVNWGNFLIEHAVKELLDLSDVRVRSLWDKRDPSWEPNAHDSLSGVETVIVSGSTVLGLPELDRLLEAIPAHVQVFIIGGCFWGTPQPTWAHSIKLLQQPNVHVGARDGHTVKLLQGTAPLVGCPTLFLPERPLERRNVFVFSFGREHPPSTFWAHTRGGFSRWTIILHEACDASGIPSSFNGTVVSIRDIGPARAFELYRSARMVITGRLHGVLPSLGYAPVVYYGNEQDTRNGLLPLIGASIYSADAPERWWPQEAAPRLDGLHMTSFLDTIRKAVYQ